MTLTPPFFYSVDFHCFKGYLALQERFPWDRKSPVGNHRVGIDLCSSSLCPNEPLENDQLAQRILSKFFISALQLWKNLLALKLKQSKNLKDVIMKIGQQISWIKVDFFKKKKSVWITFKTFKQCFFFSFLQGHCVHPWDSLSCVVGSY